MECVPVHYNEGLRGLLAKLSTLNEVTIAQAQDLILLDAKQYFSETLAMYPHEGFDEYLSENSHLVKDKVFESAVCKVLNKEE